MAMLHEEELSELAGDISVYVLLAAMLLVFVAGQACTGGWGCAVAHVVTKIWAQAILVLLLLPLALVLFFRRAAGCSSKAADAESLSVKDVEERPYDFSLALMWLLLVAMLGTFAFVFYMYGYPDLADLFGHAVLVVVFLCEAFLYVRAALSLWKMNPTPKPSSMVAAE
ncbi:hypothetical protein CFC21_055213 [Triticum aestivum]|uniref:Uncharacterized protein n=2 Tax=Triticum aestivum TaxID=4565 RepID=A0A3B6I574_WHEAT|nr:uncharacterized protein LOC123083333 [Triticum aestivum]XP_044361335.1 uncharacterized protein LOC123083333 [Triticum aestivum]KAF7046163.1 hypothetical protein CFC21_055213 [Triticum aestivum]